MYEQHPNKESSMKGDSNTNSVTIIMYEQKRPNNRLSNENTIGNPQILIAKQNILQH